MKISATDLRRISVTRTCRLVLKVNSSCSVGVDFQPGETLEVNLHWLRDEVHERGYKVNGVTELLRHTKINGVPILPSVKLLLNPHRVDDDRVAGRLKLI